MILFFRRVLTHYALPLFRELNKASGVIVCFGKKGPANTFLSKIQPDFQHYQIADYYPFSKNKNLVIQDVITPLLKFKPDIIILESALSMLSNWLLFLLRPFFKYKLILHSHGWNRKLGFCPERSFIDRLRVWLMNRADAVVVYSKEGKAAISKYLNKPEKVFVGQNTLDTNKLVKIREEFEKNGKENIKKEVGFKAKYNLIYVGRILKEKEPDRLIEVFDIVKGKLDSIGLHIVGDGPFMAELKNKYNNSKIKFWGTVIDDYKVGKLLFASDLMIVPGCLGLSIVHAFCFDIPVLSQKVDKKSSFHGPEIEYLREGKTGFLVEYGNDHLIADTIISYLLDERQKQFMKQEIRKMIDEECNFDRMIKGFSEAIDYVK